MKMKIGRLGYEIFMSLRSIWDKIVLVSDQEEHDLLGQGCLDGLFTVFGDQSSAFGVFSTSGSTLPGHATSFFENWSEILGSVAGELFSTMRSFAEVLFSTMKEGIPAEFLEIMKIRVSLIKIS